MNQRISETIKPCPFCGGESIRLKVPTWWCFGHGCKVAVCDSCGAIAPAIHLGEDDKSVAAIAAWNTRTAPPEAA
jgi:Lar family restriction alleviation protein